ncbi:nucleotidyltransferase domain-containing protein [Erythrobacter sp. BLCC-B19]|uniref:nucleotidyltransferase domain-containing protein n=1 Tax=Erythrobacter sp. BLCC-B19 TaxID=3025315 RepID=UPI00235FAF14|nr:nucleotidyltransferase [Erythrobacter sp. BLCC-B19]WDA39610.1 nucleotidyltransferase [Erythrobacter sp. BLCC-B19]
MATSPSSHPDTSTLDEILLDLAALIELSPYDRRVAESRYRRLKEHIERPSSTLRSYLIDGESLIYAQGSVATSTTVLSGDQDDRFDIDAIVEIDVPLDWSDDRALDELFVTLQGFPGVEKITRCTRCVQMQFAFMHMDVTIMDRRARIAGARPGHIFHSPDTGASYRVDSNPWGFTDWFRSQVGVGEAAFAEKMRAARDAASIRRLKFIDDRERQILANAEQVPLPPAIPTRIDAQEVVALKLLKRYLNLRYTNSALKRPPSVWITKLTADIGYDPRGLSHQLFTLASGISANLRMHLVNGTLPNELNPRYEPDRINDRWPRPLPAGRTDMECLVDHLDALKAALNKMLFATQEDILKEIDRMFGETFGAAEREILKKRYDRRERNSGILIKPGSGGIFAPALVKTQPELRPVPQHRFHPALWPLRGQDDE